MLRRRVLSPARSVLAAVTAGAVAVVSATGLGSGAAAQTLTDPNPPAKWTPPASKKVQTAEPAKRCRAFGPGFVNVPGTDTCVKVGGWVTIEGGAGR
jgi:Porin subfamily